jgi:hypothetical protein
MVCPLDSYSIRSVYDPLHEREMAFGLAAGFSLHGLRSTFRQQFKTLALKSYRAHAIRLRH